MPNENTLLAAIAAGLLIFHILVATERTNQFSRFHRCFDVECDDQTVRSGCLHLRSRGFFCLVLAAGRPPSAFQLGHPGRNGYGRFVGSSHDVALLVMDSVNPDHLKALARQRMKAVVNYDFT